MAFSTASGEVIPRVKRIENGMPTPTVEPSSGVKLPVNVFFGLRVVNDESSAACRPAASLAIACTWYFVDAARCVAGVQPAPSAVIAPLTAVPLASLTTTSVSLPFAAVTFSAPLVSTPVAPLAGRMLTTASDCALCAASAALPLPSFLPEPAFPAPESPLPPHAVTVSRRTPDSSAIPRFRPRTEAPDAPDIGRTFKFVLPS